MKFNIKKKPRIFTVGFDKSFIVKDFGKINVDHADKEFELLTFSNKKKEYDFGITNWGYYATPSINVRLKNNGYQTFLVKNIFRVIKINRLKDNVEKIMNQPVLPSDAVVSMIVDKIDIDKINFENLFFLLLTKQIREIIK